jgi:DNA helicase-2/ATP-dependent DNA helicase PcrA
MTPNGHRRPPAADDLLADLTPAQQEAVTHSEGPLLILAGAGSGKTRVITRRVAWLLRQGVRPFNILAITFTNKAAGEMRQRVEAIVPNSRVWVSTFHSLGARLLRQYHDRVNLDRNFTIYDQNDRTKLVKDALEAAGIDNVRFTPDRIAGAISKAKNQLLTPDRYEQKAGDFFSKTVARVYYHYDKRLREVNALDFDDLLLIPALALRHDEELRAELDSRFRFVLIDEYQDTNTAQYEIARRLSLDQPNLCVVGDPDQCLLPGTLVQTQEGSRPIETFRDGDTVISGTGWGKASNMIVDKVMVSPYSGPAVTIEVEGGIRVRATPNHVCFARLHPKPVHHYVYLMWKKGVGYRLGTTRGVRASKDGVILSGLQVRTNQEVADAVWIVRSCRSSAEARYFEHYYSVRYGIPTMVFFVRGRRMDMTQEWIDRLFRDIDTEAQAAQLMADLHIDRRYPHHRPGAITRGELCRRYVMFTVYGDIRPKLSRCWHEHRVQLVTSGDEVRERAAERFRVRNGQRGTWRIETSRKGYDDGWNLARAISELDSFDVIPRARLTPAKAFTFTPASHIHPGMIVPILDGNTVVEREVVAVSWDTYQGPVYDLSVPHTRNFGANGLLVHNSIYKWRGSDIRNILDFERDFPDARVITLDLNYRSTKSILASADALIAHNKQRKPKDLRTNNPQGEPVRVLTFDTGLDEAEGVVQRIKDANKQGRPFRDFAIFLRINALSRALESAFVKHGVPFQIVKGLAFFERKENRDVLAYLRLLVNPQDDLSFLRVVNEPARGVGDISLKHLRNYSEPRELPLLAASADVAKIPQIRGKAANGLRDFHRLMTDLRQHLDDPPDEVIRHVIEKSGYRAMLQGSKDEDDQERLANVEELITAAKQFADEDSSRTIGDFLEQITLASDVDSWDERQDCVSVMTLHAAKGLEFPVVYMLAVEQGLLPHERSLAKDEDVEEERRLCFVGMTRAKNELYLSHARLREFRGQALYTVPSMFLEELPHDGIETVDLSHHSGGPAAPDYWRGGSAAAAQGWHDTGYAPRPPAKPKPDENGYAVGVIVEHGMYGRGQILDISGHGALRRLKIRFAKHGEKTFVADKVKLTVIIDD